MPLCALNICAIAFAAQGLQKCSVPHADSTGLSPSMCIIARYLTPRIPRQFAQTRLDFLKPGFITQQPRAVGFMFISQVPHGGHPERIRGSCHVPGCVSDAPGVQGGACLVPEITHVTTAQAFGQLGDISGSGMLESAVSRASQGVGFVSSRAFSMRNTAAQCGTTPTYETRDMDDSSRAESSQ